MRKIDDVPLAINLACQWEALAAKPGNVHRTADFVDTRLTDFLASGAAVAAVAQSWVPRWLAPGQGSPCFGHFIAQAVAATGQVASSNTNLGICLLLGPLAEAYAAVSDSPASTAVADWQAAVGQLIDAAPVEQTRAIYAAIAAARPGGMGQVPAADVAAGETLQPSDTVRRVMGLAAQRDSIAAEYVAGFPVTFQETAPMIVGYTRRGFPLQWSIIGTYLRLWAAHPDSLIARKNGVGQAQQVSAWAAKLCRDYFPPGPQEWLEFQARQEACEAEVADFDFSLRRDGNRLNPGTTADLIAAGLFVSLMSGGIPLRVRW
jgi:triphosphoribosyl-dephospho-CoA synthase